MGKASQTRGVYYLGTWFLEGDFVADMHPGYVASLDFICCQ